MRRYLTSTATFKKSLVAGIISVFIAWAVLLSAAPVQADTLLDFQMNSPTVGSISYAGGAAALIGSGISVDSLFGQSTPANSGVALTCSGCFLNFTTGASTGAWQWGEVGSITIAGTLLNAASEVVASGTLLSGSFGEASVFAVGASFRIAAASFFDTKNADLVAYYGFAPGTSFLGNFNLSFNAPGSAAPGAFTSSSVLGGDVFNAPVPTPEPTSLLLLGSGLAGAGLWARKRRKVV